MWVLVGIDGGTYILQVFKVMKSQNFSINDAMEGELGTYKALLESIWSFSAHTVQATK